MRRTIRLFLASAAAAAAAPVSAAVIVVGNSAAHSCYVASDGPAMPGRDDFAACNRALSEEALSEHDYVATLVNRGILSMKAHRYDAAIADFDAAIGRDPNQAEAYLDKGLALLDQGRAPDSTLGLFDEALAKRTRRPELAYYGRGIANELSGKLRAAYEDYRQAESLAPRWNQPKLELSRFRVGQP